MNGSSGTAVTVLYRFIQVIFLFFLYRISLRVLQMVDNHMEVLTYRLDMIVDLTMEHNKMLRTLKKMLE